MAMDTLTYIEQQMLDMEAEWFDPIEVAELGHVLDGQWMPMPPAFSRLPATTHIEPPWGLSTS